MTHSRMTLALVVAVLICTAACSLAQNPVNNPSFEDGLEGWTTYTYTIDPNGEPAAPQAGCIGPSPCPFDLLSPPAPPNGSSVCGSQSSHATANGGVRQVFFWQGGPAILTVMGRAYSEQFPELGGGALDNGCRVRFALLDWDSANRGDVTSWTELPWGSGWNTASVTVPGSSTYTLFIESVQPEPNAVMSTLWDNFTWTVLPVIEGTLNDPVVPGDPLHPDSTARITWTTSVPSTSRVDFGTTTSYGQFVEDPRLVTNHIVQLAELDHTSTYHCKATSTATGYVPWVSQDVTLDTPIQFDTIFATPGVSGTDFVVVWTTDVVCSSRVEYGLTESYGLSSPEDTDLTKSHQVTLTGLEEDKTYHFRVWGRNAQGNYSDACSQDQTLHTLPPPSPYLQNGSFETPQGAASYGLYPWVQYASPDNNGEFHPIDGVVGPYPAGGSMSWTGGVKAHDGAYFLGAGAIWGHKTGGVFQRICCPADQIVTLSAFFTAQNAGGLPSDTQVRLGIDPNGGVDPQGANVVWWSVYSPSSDSRWYPAAVTARTVSTTITAFLEFDEWYNFELQVAAIDHAAFGPPVPMTVGQLKGSEGDRSVTLSQKTVTYVDMNTLLYYDKGYVKAYVQDDDVPAGIAVIFDQWLPDIPNVGDKVTVTGSVVLRDVEAMVLAYEWTTTPGPFTQPRARAMSSRSIGGITPIQPALYPVAGLCTVGLRTKIFGRVTSIVSSDPFAGDMVTLDDGAGIVDQWPARGGVAKGMRAELARNGADGVSEGDYIEVTGIVTMRLVDPNGWPSTGDEYYVYAVASNGPEDWHVIKAASSP